MTGLAIRYPLLVRSYYSICFNQSSFKSKFCVFNFSQWFIQVSEKIYRKKVGAREISKVEFGKLTFLLLDPLSLIAGVDCFASVMIFSDEDVSAVEYIVTADGLPKERNVNCVILYIVKLTKP